MSAPVRWVSIMMIALGLAAILVGAVLAYRRARRELDDISAQLDEVTTQLYAQDTGGPPVNFDHYPKLRTTIADLAITRGLVTQAVLRDALDSVRGAPALLALSGVVLQTVGGVLPLLWP